MGHPPTPITDAFRSAQGMPGTPQPHSRPPDSRCDLSLNPERRDGEGQREIPENPLWGRGIGTGRISGQVICRTDRWMDPLIYGVSAGQGSGRGPGTSLGERQREITGRGSIKMALPGSTAGPDVNLSSVPLSPNPPVPPARQLCQCRATLHLCTAGVFPGQLVRDKL